MSCKKKQKHMIDERARHGKECMIDFIKGELSRVVSAFQSTLTQDMIFHSFEKAAQIFPLSLDKSYRFTTERFPLRN